MLNERNLFQWQIAGVAVLFLVATVASVVVVL